MKNIVLYLIFCAVILSGCDRDPIDDIDGVHDIVINFTFESLPLSLLKSTTEATEAEKRIDEIMLLGVDDTGAFWQDFTVAESILFEPGGVTLSDVYRRIRKFYAIANPTTAMKTAITAAKNANPTTLNVAFLEGMICDFSAHPQSPFVMSGIGDVNGYVAAIDIERTVARVEITMPENFTFQSVSVFNTPNRGFVFKKAPLLTLPAGNAMTTYPPNVSQASTTTAVIYVAENTTSSPTQFIVTGLYDNLPTETPKFSITEGNQPIALLRNKNYKVLLNMAP